MIKTYQIDTTTFLILSLTLLFLYLLFMALKELTSKKPETRKRTISIHSCINEDYEIRKDFVTGDYVGKVVGKCPKCGNNIIIKAIYLEIEEVHQQARK